MLLGIFLGVSLVELTASSPFSGLAHRGAGRGGFSGFSPLQYLVLWGSWIVLGGRPRWRDFSLPNQISGGSLGLFQSPTVVKLVVG